MHALASEEGRKEEMHKGRKEGRKEGRKKDGTPTHRCSMALSCRRLPCRRHWKTSVMFPKGDKGKKEGQMGGK
jgi:hypothetical protein